MGLSELFNQRVIPRKHTSIRARVPLRSPSGPQETESQLETDLVVQLSFSPRVYDLITQPIIEYVDPAGQSRRYTPDVYVELYPDADGDVRYYMLEAKMADDLQENWSDYQLAFDAARAWCATNHAQFRIVTDREIRTEYLTNAKFFTRFVDLDPDSAAMDMIWSLTEAGATTVANAISAMREAGINEPDARTAIERAVANFYIACDLTAPFTDASVLFVNVEMPQSNKLDPIISLIQACQA